jgi:hypothetical protein
MHRLGLLLLFWMTPVLAAWQTVDASGNGTTYADPGTIARSGNSARMWWLLDYASFQRMVEVGYFSHKAQSEFDCAQRRTRVLELTLRAEHMGEGKSVYSDETPHDWEAVAAGSATEKLWKVACGQ